MMDKEEFEQEYSAGSDIPLDKLRKMGFVAVPCDCEYEGCEGWKAEFKTCEKNI